MACVKLISIKVHLTIDNNMIYLYFNTEHTQAFSTYSGEEGEGGGGGEMLRNYWTICSKT